MGRIARAPLKDPFEIAISQAHAYLYKQRYPQVSVFTKYLTEAHCLEEEFGGNHYVHGTGFVWVLAQRNDVATFHEKMKPYLPSQWGFEDK